MPLLETLYFRKTHAMPQHQQLIDPTNKYYLYSKSLVYSSLFLCAADLHCCSKTIKASMRKTISLTDMFLLWQTWAV